MDQQKYSSLILDIKILTMQLLGTGASLMYYLKEFKPVLDYTIGAFALVNLGLSIYYMRKKNK
jgi:hypothetical protein